MISKTSGVMATVAVAFALGLSIGGGAVYKWSVAQEAGRLKVALEIAAKEKAAALASLVLYFAEAPPIEIIKTEVEYVIKNIPYNLDCDVHPTERRMLDNTRTGVRISAPGVDASAKKSEAPEALGRLPRAAEVRAHADAAINYRQCYAVAKAVELYLVKRAGN